MKAMTNQSLSPSEVASAKQFLSEFIRRKQSGLSVNARALPPISQRIAAALIDNYEGKTV